MFLASNICCVTSGTVDARLCQEPRDVRGAKSRHEEVDPQERNEVDRTLPQIAIQLSRESDVRRHPADGGRHDMVQVSVDRNRQLQGTKTDVA